MSGGDVAEAINITPQYYYELEKGEKRLNEDLLRKLAEYFNTTLVFTSEAGGPIAPRNLYRHFNSVLDKLNGRVKRITFHNLRDTHATLLLEEGVHIKAVAERLGHTDEVTLLRRYAHALPKISKEAAVKLDALIPE